MSDKVTLEDARQLPEVRALVWLARRLEWGNGYTDDFGDWIPTCPICEEPEDEGHIPGCEYEAALAPFEADDGE